MVVPAIMAGLAVASAVSGIMGNRKAKKAAKRQAALQKEAQLKDIAFQRGELEHAKVDTIHDFGKTRRNTEENLQERFEGAGSHSSIEDDTLREVDYQKQKRLDALSRRMSKLDEHEALTQRGWALQNSMAESQATMQLINTLLNNGLSGVGAMYGAMPGGGASIGAGASAT